MNCKFWWFKLPQDIIREFTQVDGTRIASFESFNLMVADITWWKLPQKLQLMADSVEYKHKFTWCRLPKQVEDFCTFISRLLAVNLTAFNAGTTTFVQCTSIPESESLVLWHNGRGLGPVVGDTVYEDAGGTTPFYTGANSTRHCTAVVNDEFATGIDGRMISFSCK
jgi:hypothetical protein